MSGLSCLVLSARRLGVRGLRTQEPRQHNKSTLAQTPVANRIRAHRQHASASQRHAPAHKYTTRKQAQTQTHDVQAGKCSHACARAHRATEHVWALEHGNGGEQDLKLGALAIGHDGNAHCARVYSPSALLLRTVGDAARVTKGVMVAWGHQRGDVCLGSWWS